MEIDHPTKSQLLKNVCLSMNQKIAYQSDGLSDAFDLILNLSTESQILKSRLKVGGVGGGGDPIRCYFHIASIESKVACNSYSRSSSQLQTLLPCSDSSQKAVKMSSGHELLFIFFEVSSTKELRF